MKVRLISSSCNANINSWLLNTCSTMTVQFQSVYQYYYWISFTLCFLANECVFYIFEVLRAIILHTMKLWYQFSNTYINGFKSHSAQYYQFNLLDNSFAILLMWLYYSHSSLSCWYRLQCLHCEVASFGHMFNSRGSN